MAETVKPLKGVKQLWFCEQCCVLGVVVLDERCGVWEMVQALGDAHRVATPGCETPRRRLRVIDLTDIVERRVLVRFDR